MRKLVTHLALLLASSACFAQDAAVVNAKTVKVVLENERVRVLEAILPPGEKELPHSHPASVIYMVSGGRGRNHADGKVTETDFKPGTTLYREPTTHWMENIGTAPMHVILVELKGATKDKP
jgi:quercetin dioxygenase-like cupin family protein